MLHKTRVAICFGAKKPSPQTTRAFALVYPWCGRKVGWLVGERSRDCQILSDGLLTTFSYPWCFASRALRARAPLIIIKSIPRDQKMAPVLG